MANVFTTFDTGSITAVKQLPKYTTKIQQQITNVPPADKGESVNRHNAVKLDLSQYSVAANPARNQRPAETGMQVQRGIGNVDLNRVYYSMTPEKLTPEQLGRYCPYNQQEWTNLAKMQEQQMMAVQPKYIRCYHCNRDFIPYVLVENCPTCTFCGQIVDPRYKPQPNEPMKQMCPYCRAFFVPTTFARDGGSAVCPRCRRPSHTCPDGSVNTISPLSCRTCALYRK